jgi:hypothetical protein
MPAWVEGRFCDIDTVAPLYRDGVDCHSIIVHWERAAASTAAARNLHRRNFHCMGANSLL